MSNFIKATEAATISEAKADSKQDNFIAEHSDLMKTIDENIRGNAKLGADKTWFDIDDTQLGEEDIKTLKDILISYGYRVRIDFVFSEDHRCGGLGLENVQFDDDFYNDLYEFPHYTADIYVFWK